LGDKGRGWLRVDAQGVEFSSLTTTRQYLRTAHEEIAGLIGPQAGTFPEERVKSAQARNLMVRGLGLAAAVGGSMIPGVGGLVGVGVRAAEGYAMAEESGASPTNRLCLVWAARGRSRACFDVVAPTRAEMEHQAREF